MQTTYFDKGYFEMQPNYEYLEMPAGAAFELQLVVGKKMSFSLKYAGLFEDLRTVEDNYRLLKKFDILLQNSTANDLRDIELKIGLRSCAHAIVLAVCRLLEQPDRRNSRKTNCIYTRIQKDIKCENTKQRCMVRYRKLVNGQWYTSFRDVKDKHLSHREHDFDIFSTETIKNFLLEPQSMQNLITVMKELLEFSASATLNGGRAKYVPRSYI